MTQGFETLTARFTKFQKYKNGILGPANAVYDGYYNNNKFYMNFSNQFWFEREVRGLHLIKDKEYAPTLLLVDNIKNQIVFEWGESLNHTLEHNTFPLDYKDQVKSILSDLVDNCIYKINTYPWTFFILDGKVKVMDMYGGVMLKENISYHLLENIINDTDRFIFKNNMLDVKSTYQKTLEYEKQFWPEEFLNG